MAVGAYQLLVLGSNSGRAPAANARPVPSTPSPRQDLVPLCGVEAVSVSVNHTLTISVRNTTSSACALVGAPPVSMLVGRVDGPVPSTTRIELGPGETFVQPQPAVEGASACKRPISGGVVGTGHLTVSVAGGVKSVRQPSDVSAIAVVNCLVIERSPGRVVV
ncbi:hypothetical protein [Kineosporia sp. R_H_3]|uniref:hypothetical protein n=1 Tax=Kineosporia sp. R_H_3 TaxID=1961848 RepID=UPI001179CE6A|nr:hypothetical protein [Kineosporia sp. R_H_3]